MQPRRSRRGSRRPRRGGESPAPKAPVKLSFWEKLVAFFTGGPKPAPRPFGKVPEARRPERNERPAKTERTETPRQSRKPELVEVNSPKLYLGNLSFDAAESDIFELFRGVGNVQNVEIVSHKYTQKSKGFGFVTMQTVEEARRAVTELHDKEFMGRKLVVSGAKTSDVPRTASSAAE